MLRIDLQGLSEGPVSTEASIPAEDSLFEGLDFSLRTPVGVSGRLSEAGRDRYYWHAKVTGEIELPCRRCLERVMVGLDFAIDVLFRPDGSEVEEDASVYVFSPRDQALELKDTVREELILAAPKFVVCREDCKGICPGCGTDLNLGECRCEPSTDPRWAALDALRTTRSEEER